MQDKNAMSSNIEKIKIRRCNKRFSGSFVGITIPSWDLLCFNDRLSAQPTLQLKDRADRIVVGNGNTVYRIGDLHRALGRMKI